MAGRPTKFHPKYCDKVIEHMKQGLSIESFAATIGVSKQTLYTWKEVYPEFLDAIKKGEAQSLLFWERKGIDAVNGKIPGFNSAIWIFNMKNRFKWTDRSDTLSREVEKEEDEEEADQRSDNEKVKDALLHGKELIGKLQKGEHLTGDELRLANIYNKYGKRYMKVLTTN